MFGQRGHTAGDDLLVYQGPRGVVAVIEKLKGHPLFAHVTLVRSERSPIAALVTEMLEDVGL